MSKQVSYYLDNTPNANRRFSNTDSRPNKTTRGFTKHYERWSARGRVRISNDKHPDYNKRGTSREILSLIVHGTTDSLKGLGMLYKKKIKKEHPVDKGYFKEVYILTDSGRAKLKRLKLK